MSTWTDKEILVMDTYLWLDYSIEIIWLHYVETFQGEYSVNDFDEKQILEMMEVVYNLESEIIDLIDKHQISFSTIDRYKEEHSVRSWPTRFR